MTSGHEQRAVFLSMQPRQRDGSIGDIIATYLRCEDGSRLIEYLPFHFIIVSLCECLLIRDDSVHIRICSFRVMSATVLICLMMSEDILAN